jgi:hypothetical protein
LKENKKSLTGGHSLFRRLEEDKRGRGEGCSFVATILFSENVGSALCCLIELIFLRILISGSAETCTITFQFILSKNMSITEAF